MLLGFYDINQKKHALLINFPVFGWGRYLMEVLRPKIYQYFVESDIDGRPISRIHRSLVYQRAKGEIATTPFGTQLNVESVGYEWMNHSISARDMKDLSSDLRTTIGGPDCDQKYNASILNISAMSFGSLSKNAIEALNKGAKFGNFAHNTGEGGISPYHLKHGGDLIWQIGTGYFGCRDKDGKFSPSHFKENVQRDSVKMVEIKLSQGAKPGHGGILPAKKNTLEIAKIRGVDPFEPIISPPFHTTFTTPLELLEFIQTLRKESNGKPIGFKLCVGSKIEFLSICKAMNKLKIYPDFITVDGGEGGSGATYQEMADSMGVPIKSALIYCDDALRRTGVRDRVKIFASGKLFSPDKIAIALASGADLINIARGMMISVGCIGAQKCHTNKCPVGVATTDPEHQKALVVDEKKWRVLNYVITLRNGLQTLAAASGLDSYTKFKRDHVVYRDQYGKVTSLEKLFPYPDA